MKKYSTLLLLLLPFLLNAQITWERPYGNVTHLSINDIIEGPNNSYYICGHDTSNSTTRALLAKLDSAGNTLWEKYYTVQDSDYQFDHILLLDTSLIIQSASYAHVNGYYAVPKILKTDLSGIAFDSIYSDITGVYNDTRNVSLHHGANNTFWAVTYIGTTGISNIVDYTRRNFDLQLIRNKSFGAFYDFNYSFNKNGEKINDFFIEEPDSSTHILSQRDHVSLYDTTGTLILDTAYLNLPKSSQLLLNDDGSYNLFYNHADTLTIRRFNNSGVQQQISFIKKPISYIYPPTQAIDTGYFLFNGIYNLALNTYSYTMYKLNNSDDTIWSQTLSLPYGISYITMQATSDGGVILLFPTNYYGDSLSYFMKFGPNGERFPYSLQTNKSIYCSGDTVQLTTLYTASSYLWTTGEITPFLNVTSTGNYGVTVIDSLGNSYTVAPIPITFDSLQQLVLNDVHTCQTSVSLYNSQSGANTYWSTDGINYSWVYPGYFTTTIVPDTLPIWLIEQKRSGCRTMDSAFIYFDNCSGVSSIYSDTKLLQVHSSLSSITVQSNNSSNFSRLYLLSVDGKLIFEQLVNDNLIEINTEKLTPGIYILKCVVDNNFVTKKLVLIH